MIKYCLFAAFLLTVGCSSLNIGTPKEKPYNRERICEETSRQLAFANTSAHKRKKLSKEKHDQLVNRYMLNGCDK
jgi:hypothetical protein